MEILDTQLSMVRISDQYMEAKKLNIDVDEDLKYEYKSVDFKLVLGKVVGYKDAPGRSESSGTICTTVFVDSDSFNIAIPFDDFDRLMKKYYYNAK